MSNLCMLFGEIRLNSKNDADALHAILERRIYLDCYEFDSRKNILIIDAGFDDLKQINWLEKYVYQKIASIIPEGSYERLYFKEGQFFSCVFFGHRKCEIVHYESPVKPAWWRPKN